MKPYLESLLMIAAIVAGSLVGLFTSFQSSWTDYFILAMLFFLFYNISLDKLFKQIKNKRYLLTALLSNFVAIPTIAFLLASMFVSNESAIFIGLIIYMVAPCTDWYLGFTKLAGGDVELNSALLPFNLLLQILLLPVYLYAGTSNSFSIPFDAFFEVMVYWVLLPFVIAQMVRLLVNKLKPFLFEKSVSLSERLTFIAIVLLIFSIFNSNVESLIENAFVLPKMFAAILSFFILTFFLARFISRASSFSKKEEVSLTMTTAARNAPLMLAVSLIFFPDEPLIHLVLVVGMLVEFPHLITITYFLKKKVYKRGLSVST
ncbi:arsenic resistance protein [Reichenbachiella versicolor]|uniref:arsenic resistance protein n=1 Tax=Reichenbachiella versicolor TaxID=1821036 RepID=UPI000D6E1890|nr:bile acid:sodium symporter [Reichenbachiella versicolor]